MPEAPIDIVDREDLRRTLARVLRVDVGEVEDETLFIEDLDVDSLLALEVAVVLEKKYGVRMVESDLRELTCLRAAHELMRAKLAVVPAP
ncbi:MAG: acyl carrier protein [Mycobacteriales bacterium]